MDRHPASDVRTTAWYAPTPGSGSEPAVRRGVVPIRRQTIARLGAGRSLLQLLEEQLTSDTTAPAVRR